MTKRLKFLVPLFLFLALIVLFKLGLGRDPNLLPSLLENKPLPAFSSPALQNTNQVISSEEFMGKITVLNVWASWCEGCQIEMPLLFEIAKRPGIHVYGLDYKDSQRAANDFLAKTGNPYRATFFDPSGKIAMRLGVYGTPETFLIDNKGIVRYRYVGPITLSRYENDLLPKIKLLENNRNVIP